MTNREQVIDGLEKVWDAFNHMEHELYADYVFDALELLKEQPQKGEWIPVSERLPEAKEGFFGTPYIVLTKNGTVIPLWYVEKIIRGTWVRRWEYYGGHIYHGEVIAWAPMPEPPKGALLNE